MNNLSESTIAPAIFTPEALLDHWQGHRRVTRRMIEAFPEDELFIYSIGGMRPFSAMVMEFIGMAEPGMDGVATGNWDTVKALPHHDKKFWPKTKKELLQRWDQVTEKIDRLWLQIPPQRFNELDKAFGQWEGPVYSFITYWIDNEIHHRGQAYVYLRSLGIEPPAFYDRS